MNLTQIYLYYQTSPSTPVVFGAMTDTKKDHARKRDWYENQEKLMQTPSELGCETQAATSFHSPIKALPWSSLLRNNFTGQEKHSPMLGLNTLSCLWNLKPKFFWEC